MELHVQTVVPSFLFLLIQLVEASVGKQAVIEIAPEQPGDVDRTCADITKAKALLGAYRCCSCCVRLTGGTGVVL